MHTITQRILAFNESRLTEKAAIKYDFMRENMFRFFRGSCHLFYEDLAAFPDWPASPVAWISGDAHIENFGSFRADNDQVYFDLNDFDEAILAPVTWEITRLACSIFIGFRSLSIGEEKAEKMVRLVVRSYAATLAQGRAEYVEQSTATGIICDFLARVSRRKQRRLLEKKTTFGKKRVRMDPDHPKHIALDKSLRRELCDHVQAWLGVDDNSPYNYSVTDAVFRLAGTGSVGLERYAFVLKSNNQVGPKYLLLDMKEAVASSLAPFVGIEQPGWPSEAERVVCLQKRMQNRFPALLSWSHFKGKSFIMQEMQPTKDNINFGLLKDRYRDMYRVVDSLAILTASSHLRSGGQDGSCTTDELKAFGRREDWQEVIVEAARKMAERMDRYYQEFVAFWGKNATTSHGAWQATDRQMGR